MRDRMSSWDEAMLAMLALVIAVDAKVVELEKAVRKLTDAAWSDFPDAVPAHTKERNHQAWFNDLLDAAREVAGKEER